MAETLTEDTVKTTKAPASGAVTIWDDKIRGFGLRIFAPTKSNPDGARSFFLNYRKDGFERRITIGAWSTWSAKAARTEAKELRRRVDLGEDPAVAKRDARNAPTVADLAERYRIDHLPGKAPQSQRDDWSMIVRHILPELGTRKVAGVHHGDIVALHKRITDSGHPVQANRTMAVASRMFALSLVPKAGEERPWRDQAQGNPCKGIKRNPEQPKERFFSSAELAAVSEALASYQGRSSANCIAFVMLTGCRPSEARLATWRQFDAEPGFWVKPLSLTKQRRVSKVPLSPPARQLLDDIRRPRGDVDPDGYVFPGLMPGEPIQQLRWCWDWVRESATVTLWAASGNEKVANIINDLRVVLAREPTVGECQEEAKRLEVNLSPSLLDARIYDLRHTFASTGAGGGLSLPIIGRLLGHTLARTTQRYAHLADDPLREAADKIGNAIAAAGKPSADVVPLKRG